MSQFIKALIYNASLETGMKKGNEAWVAVKGSFQEGSQEKDCAMFFFHNSLTGLKLAKSLVAKPFPKGSTVEVTMPLVVLPFKPGMPANVEKGYAAREAQFACVGNLDICALSVKEEGLGACEVNVHKAKVAKDAAEAAGSTGEPAPSENGTVVKIG